MVKIGDTVKLVVARGHAPVDSLAEVYDIDKMYFYVKWLHKPKRTTQHNGGYLKYQFKKQSKPIKEGKGIEQLGGII